MPIVYTGVPEHGADGRESVDWAGGTLRGDVRVKGAIACLSLRAPEPPWQHNQHNTTPPMFLFPSPSFAACTLAHLVH